MGVFASQSPGFYDDLLLVDSTPVECARSRETVKRSPLGDVADYGYCASHSRFFWGFPPALARPRPMGHPEQSRWLPPNVTSATSRLDCSPARAGQRPVTANRR